MVEDNTAQNSEALFNALLSAESSTRIAAIRQLEEDPSQIVNNIERLQAICPKVPDPWSRTRLELLLGAHGQATPSIADPTDSLEGRDSTGFLAADVDSAYRQGYRYGLEQALEFTVHELSKRILALTRAQDQVKSAGIDVPRLDQSIEDLQGLVTLYRNLRPAQGKVEFQDGDLTELVKRTVVPLQSEWSFLILSREDPVGARFHPESLPFAIENVVRNACEAATHAKPDEGPKVVVSWGRSQRFWVSVLDNGLGFPGPAEDYADLGRTTKDPASHKGVGLTLVYEVMERHSGFVKWGRRSPQGMQCELVWGGG